MLGFTDVYVELKPSVFDQSDLITDDINKFFLLLISAAAAVAQVTGQKGV